jgi:hypothetical protein
MLLVDGVEYHLYRFPKEEELEELVEANSKKIFGDDSIYFNVKTRFKSPSGMVSIPDGYAITLTKPYKWFIVEAELSSHPIYEHVVSQLTKFINGLKNSETRKSLVKSLHDIITSDPVQEAWIKSRLGSGEVYKFLNDLIDDPPKLVVVIDEKTSELEEALSGLPLSEKYAMEFKVYEREGVGLRNILSFDSLLRNSSNVKRSSSRAGSEMKGSSALARAAALTRKSLPKGSITSQSAYTTPILESLVEMGGTGKTRDVLSKVFDKMKDHLTEADMRTLPSGRDTRWSNHAMWERFKMMKKGLLKPKSQSGVWEISDEGRAYLKSDRK